MSDRRRRALSIVAIAFFLLAAGATVGWGQGKGEKGKGEDGGGPPVELLGPGCELPEGCPHIVAWISDPGPDQVPAESTSTYQLTVLNDGDAWGAFLVTCESQSQLPCLLPDPEEFGLGPDESEVVTVGFETLGLGTYYQKHIIEASDALHHGQTIRTGIQVTGLPLVTHVKPLEGDTLSVSDTLVAIMYSPTGIVEDSIKVMIGASDYTSQASISDSMYTLTGLNLTAGEYIWKTWACSNSGRCEWQSSTFEFVGPASPLALDDSLPPPVGAEPLFGLLPGALPLPDIEYRGCPVGSDDPEMRLVGPTSYLSQPGSSGYPGGLIFMASAVSTATISLSVLHVDHVPADSITCSSFTWLDEEDYDWSFWQHSDPQDPLWESYPYPDMAFGEFELLGEYATVGGLPGFGPSPGETRASGHGASRWAREENRAAIARRREAQPPLSEMFIPEAGAINPDSYLLTLNGDTLVHNGSPRTGVTMVAQALYGSTFTIDTSHASLNMYNPQFPSSENGGWNELIATIADSSGNATSVRSRFVAFDAGPVAPLTLTAMRDFRRRSQSDCAAFGAFQCGEVLLTQTIPGFVSHDKPRDLHLVYRSGSVGGPTIVPVKITIDRLQKAPDSLWVFAKEDGVNVSDTTRYAGLYGGPGGHGTNPLWEHSNEERVVGAELDPPSSGDVAIREVDITVRAFYPGSSQDNVLTLEVVQVQPTSTFATRFGLGWSVAEIGHLYSGLELGGDSAVVWLRGDGSYDVFRKNGSAWEAPPGVHAQLAHVDTTGLYGVEWIVTPANGSRIGFWGAGRWRWTEDLLGNRAWYTGFSGTSNYTLKGQGRYLRMNYDAAGASGKIGNIYVTDATGTGPKVATLGYDSTGTRLASLTIWRSASESETTVFEYDAAGLLTSLTTPDSLETTFVYDDILGTPERITGPSDRYGPVISDFRGALRRTVPRFGYGRKDTTGTGETPLERLIYPQQMIGTWVDPARGILDFTVDTRGAPTWVREINPSAIPGQDSGVVIPDFSLYPLDDVRHIERDSVGQVLRVVHQRFIAELADSVMYEYDALGRVERIITPTAAYPAAAGALDTVAFSYDSIDLGTAPANGGRWCSRMLTSTDPLGAVTTTIYGTSGAGKCLPAKIVGPAADTTIFTYGTLSSGVASATRPISIRDPNGLETSATYDATYWNTKTTVREADNATSTAYYDADFGRIDSIIDPAGTRTELWRDYTGRVSHSKTGTDTLAPVTRNTYDAAGRLVQVEVYAAEDGDLDTPLDSVQTTRHFFDPVGKLDSLLGPGVRSGGTKEGRKQSWVRDRRGNPIWEFPGNGSYIARLYDWKGRVTAQVNSQVSQTVSVDGEPFASASTVAFYDSLYLSMGANLSAGQAYHYVYDNAGRRVHQRGRDLYFGDDSLTSQTFEYAPHGQLIQESFWFDNGISVRRHYQYNRRGQRTQVADTVDLPLGSDGDGRQGLVTYHYGNTTARLDSIIGWEGTTMIGRIRWVYDAGGRETDRWVRIGASGHEVHTTTSYDAEGRITQIFTRDGGKTWYKYSNPSWDPGDELTEYDVQQGLYSSTASYAMTFDYADDGTRRLLASHRDGYKDTDHTYEYDVFGNRVEEYHDYNSGGFNQCDGPSTNSYGPDNRVLFKDAPTLCDDTKYWTDQAGNRLAEEVLDGSVQQSVHRMSYTAAGQLYYSLMTTYSPGNYDVNWHWYDAVGKRVITHRTTTNTWVPNEIPEDGSRTYYVYDGTDVALTIIDGPGGMAVWQRFLVGGLDQPLLGRFRENGLDAFQNLALIADRQGSTLAAVKEDGVMELDATYYSTDAFGAGDAGGATPGDLGTGTGYTGASTPNQNGGFVYLRNRWYDPNTGRFLTQDPIGLAGGVNLYAYAGNNPVAFKDPFGLKQCPPPPCDMLFPGWRPQDNGKPVGHFMAMYHQTVSANSTPGSLGLGATVLGVNCTTNGGGRAGEPGCSFTPTTLVGAGINLTRNICPDGSSSPLDGVAIGGGTKHLGASTDGCNVTVEVGWSVGLPITATFSSEALSPDESQGAITPSHEQAADATYVHVPHPDEDE